MDESWRARIGMPADPRRNSAAETAAGTSSRSTEALDPADFADVFGGPPRSILSRKFSGDFTRSSPSFYEEIFRPPEFASSSVENNGGGRSLPAFRIPATGDGFYSDVFGWEDGRRSRDRSKPNSKAKSKSNSSSVISSEELSPCRRPVAGDDVALSSFTSKLRPINVPCRWNSTTMRPEELSNKEEMPFFQFNDYFRSSNVKPARQVPSLETASLGPTSQRSTKIQVGELKLNSPASPASSICQEPELHIGIEQHNRKQEGEMETEDDEILSSYVIEINSENREVGSNEEISVDDAIAWAKGKFHSQSFDSSKDHSAQLQENVECRKQQNDGTRQTVFSTEEEMRKRTIEEEAEQSVKDMELELLDEEIRLWSAGKETNMRMLLSTLHHILWPNSGWLATPLTGLIESSQVKKAYQKARLCLHPDKLQQRGATLRQKYIAEKTFLILQDAWAAFISQDVLFN